MQRFGCALFAAVVVALAACGGGKSYTTIEVDSPGIDGVDHLDVGVTIGGASAKPLAVKLPDSYAGHLPPAFQFALAFDGREGALDVHVSVQGASGAELASGDGHGSVKAGEVSTVAVTLDVVAAGDMAMPDLTMSSDLTIAHDLAVPDQAVPSDMATSDLKPLVDMAMPDLKPPVDLAKPDLAAPDLGPPVDLATPDLVPYPDLAPPPDLTPPSPDLLGNCGPCNVGEVCCGLAYGCMNKCVPDCRNNIGVGNPCPMPPGTFCTSDGVCGPK